MPEYFQRSNTPAQKFSFIPGFGEHAQAGNFHLGIGQSGKPCHPLTPTLHAVCRAVPRGSKMADRDPELRNLLQRSEHLWILLFGQLKIKTQVVAG